MKAPSPFADDLSVSQPSLLIAGASARAAAQSARRAGFKLVAADLFHDRDLLALCDATQLGPNYHGLESLVQQARPDFWLYTGALENHFQLVQTVSAQATLLGNDVAVLRQVRDPTQLARVVQQVGLPFPETVEASNPVPREGRWLIKPKRSAAGIGVGFVTQRTKVSSDHYYQRYVAGQPCSAVFLAYAGGAYLLGVTQQLVGDDTFGSSGFRYTGSIGPLDLAARRRDWQDLGACLAVEFRMIGLFGVDAIATAQTIVPIEVNPRYTASAEVLERALGRAAIPLHIQACQRDAVAIESLGGSQELFGKAVVYSPSEVRINQSFVEGVEAMNDRQQLVADIPHPNLRVSAGSPLVTVFAQGATTTEVYDRLAQRARKVESLL